MNFCLVSDGGIVVSGLDEGWNALVARALDPGSIGGPLGEAIQVFGEIFARHLDKPANARRECVSYSETFASICTYRGIPAETMDGFLPGDFPPFDQETAVHTAVQTAASEGQADDADDIVVDWTGPQFDPGCPLPLIVTPADWWAFWRKAQQQQPPPPPRLGWQGPISMQRGQLT